MKDTALIIFTDSKGLVLLQQKTYDAPNFPGVWSLFGGTVESNESALEAAQRETEEELGFILSTDAFKFLRDFPCAEKNRKVFTACIENSVVPMLREGRGLGYFTREEVRALSIPDHIREILAAYFGLG